MATENLAMVGATARLWRRDQLRHTVVPFASQIEARGQQKEEPRQVPSHA